MSHHNIKKLKNTYLFFLSNSKNKMSDTSLDISLKDLFYIVMRTSWSLRHRDRDEVLQSLCHYLDEKMSIPRSDLRTIMSEVGMTMREYCDECNEVVEEEGLCNTCEESHPFVRNCPSCQEKIHASPDKKFEKELVYYCARCNVMTQT